MTNINDAFFEWTRQVQLPGNLSIDDATDILQTFGPTLVDADGDAFWNGLAVAYGDLGFIQPATYVGLRNWANNNEQGANDGFVALGTLNNSLPETVPVIDAIRLQSNQDELGDIPAAQAILEGHKTGGTTTVEQLVDEALQIGIDSLDGRAEQLGTEIIRDLPPPAAAAAVAATPEPAPGNSGNNPGRGRP